MYVHQLDTVESCCHAVLPSLHPLQTCYTSAPGYTIITSYPEYARKHESHVVCLYTVRSIAHTCTHHALLHLLAGGSVHFSFPPPSLPPVSLSLTIFHKQLLSFPTSHHLPLFPASVGVDCLCSDGIANHCHPVLCLVPEPFKV